LDPTGATENLPHCLANEVMASKSRVAEGNALIRDFAEDLQSLLESIAFLCEAMDTPELDHWTLSQRRVIDKLQKAIRQAATVVDQLCIEFDVPNQGRESSIDKLTH
jgi:hypothetical protein